MRSKVGLALVGAVAFDLGVIVVPMQARAQAAVDVFMKLSDINEQRASFNFAKIEFDNKTAANACLASKGTLVESKGERYCRTPKTADASTRQPATAAPSATAGPANSIPSNQRR